MIIEMPSFQDYTTLKQKVAKLEKRNNYLAHRVSVLSKRLGINHGSKKAKIMTMIEQGHAAKVIKNDVGCSLSLVYNYIAENKKARRKPGKGTTEN